MLFLDFLTLGNGEGTGCHHIDITDVVGAETALWIGTIDGGCEDPGLFIEFPDELDVVIAGSDRKLLEVPFHRHRHQLDIVIVVGHAVGATVECHRLESFQLFGTHLSADPRETRIRTDTDSIDGVIEGDLARTMVNPEVDGSLAERGFRGHIHGEGDMTVVVTFGSGNGQSFAHMKIICTEIFREPAPEYLDGVAFGWDRHLCAMKCEDRRRLSDTQQLHFDTHFVVLAGEETPLHADPGFIEQ